jgi:hypothetical protein
MTAATLPCVRCGHLPQRGVDWGSVSKAGTQKPWCVSHWFIAQGFCMYPSATGGGVKQGRHRRPRPNLLTRLRVVIARALAKVDQRQTPPHQD